MKRLIKLVILIVVLAVLAFSQNPTITKGRNFVIREGKTLFGWTEKQYQKGVDAIPENKIKEIL